VSEGLLTPRGELRAVALSNRAVAVQLTGIAGLLMIFLLTDPDRSVGAVIATAAGIVFALVAAGVPMMYSVADHRLEYWGTRLAEGKDVDDAGPQLRALAQTLCLVVLSAVYLLAATVLAVVAAYSDDIDGILLDALLSTAFGFMLAGLGLTLCFIVGTARLGFVLTVRNRIAEAARARSAIQRPPLTKADIDALTNAATPHFALQLRDTLSASLAPLAEDDPLRAYGEERVKELEEQAKTPNPSTKLSRDRGRAAQT
jgi:hypothetical protein